MDHTDPVEAYLMSTSLEKIIEDRNRLASALFVSKRNTAKLATVNVVVNGALHLMAHQMKRK